VQIEIERRGIPRKCGVSVKCNSRCHAKGQGIKLPWIEGTIPENIFGRRGAPGIVGIGWIGGSGGAAPELQAEAAGEKEGLAGSQGM